MADAFWWCPSTNGACVRKDCIGCVCKDLQDQWDARVYPDGERLKARPTLTCRVGGPLHSCHSKGWRLLPGSQSPKTWNLCQEARFYGRAQDCD